MLNSPAGSLLRAGHYRPWALIGCFYCFNLMLTHTQRRLKGYIKEAASTRGLFFSTIRPAEYHVASNLPARAVYLRWTSSFLTA